MRVFSISVIMCTLIYYQSIISVITYYQLVPIVKNNDDADDDDDDGGGGDDIDFNDEVVVVVVGGASQDEPVLDMYWFLDIESSQFLGQLVRLQDNPLQPKWMWASQLSTIPLNFG